MEHIKRRKFTSEFKLKVLQEALKNAIEVTLRKYSITGSVFYRWKERYALYGEAGLVRKLPERNVKVKALEKENELLKKALGRMALEKELIEELLKKTFSISEKKLIIKSCKLTGKYPMKHVREKLKVSKSMIYHVPSNKKRGAKPSKTTPHKDKSDVLNKVVIEQLKCYLNNTNFCKYGYKNCNSVLNDSGYTINHKKLYRLMKSEALLLRKQTYRNNKRQFVSHRKIETQKPLQYICMDIIQFYFPKENKKAFF